MWKQALSKIEENSFMSEKCEGDFHIFNGDSDSGSPILWEIEIGRN
jgi:hypothetical protein